MASLARYSLLAGVLLGMTVPAAATSSFTGDFVNDNDVQFFNFTVLAATTVTLETFGYGGGINAHGDVIPLGGFESTLQIFDVPSGNISAGAIFPGPDPDCGPRNPDPNRFNFCQDDYAQVFLNAGDYMVALTQYPNVANSTNLSDGFFYDSDPNFNNGFVGTFGFPGDSHWALDIVGADSASVAGVPEPASAALVASAFLLASLRLRKRLR